MPKKTDNFYFNNFKNCVTFSYEAAKMLKKVLTDFNVSNLDKNLKEMHEIEHKADEKKHEMTNALIKAFITPIERTDIIKLSEFIDDITDSIDDILMHIYCNNITVLRDDTIAFVDILLKCCSSLELLFEEFKNYKKSATLNDLIIEINHLEEEGDALYIKAMRTLHTTSKDLFEIMVWREMYGMFEQIYDNCEHVADVVEGVIIENS